MLSLAEKISAGGKSVVIDNETLKDTFGELKNAARGFSTENKTLNEAFKEITERQEPITIEDVQQLFKSFGVKSVLRPNDALGTLMTYCCRTDQMTVPMMQLIVDEAKKVGGTKNECLKEQLEYALHWHIDGRYSGVTLAAVACAGCSSLPVVQLIFATCIEVFNKEWLAKQLLLNVGGHSRKNTALEYICSNARSIDIVRFVFSTLLDQVGKAALSQQLERKDDHHRTLLVVSCSHESSSVEMAQLIMDQYAVVEATDLLTKHLVEEYSQSGQNSKHILSIVGGSSSPDSVFEFLVSSISKICGAGAQVQELLDTVVRSEFGEKIDRVKLMLGRIIRCSGTKAALKRQLENKREISIVQQVLFRNNTFDMLQFLIDTVKDAFGSELVLKNLLGNVLPGAEENVLDMVVQDSESTARLDLVIRVTLELGGPSALKALLTEQQNQGNKTPLHRASSFSKKDKVPVQKLKLLINQIISVGGKSFLSNQLEAAGDSDGNTCLHFACTSCSELEEGADEAVHVLLDAIVFAGGSELLKSILGKRTEYAKVNLVTRLFAAESSRFETVKIILSTIIDAGGKNLMRKYLRHLDKDRKPPLSLISKESRSEHSLAKLFVALLAEFDLFQEQYSALGDSEKQKLKETSKIENEEWLPSEEDNIFPLENNEEGINLKEIVNTIFHGAFCSETLARVKQFEEEATAALKKFDEDAEAKTKNKEAEEQPAADKNKVHSSFTLIKTRMLRDNVRELAKQDTITIDDVKMLIQFFGAEKVLASTDLPDSQSLMMYLCSVDQMTVPMIQLLIDEAKKNPKGDFLKKQLKFQSSWVFDKKYGDVSFVAAACAGSSSVAVLQLIFSTCIETFGKEWVLKQLQASIGKYENETRFLTWIGIFARSLEVARFVFNTFLDIGGVAALVKELEHVKNGKTALTAICSQENSSVEKVQLFMDQYSKAGGDDDEFLKKHLTLETEYRIKANALTVVAISPCPDAVFEFFVTSLEKISGAEILRKQLTESCGKWEKCPLANICARCGESIGHAKFVISKILELGSADLLKKQFESISFKDIFDINESVRMLQLLIDTLKDNFGTAFLIQYLFADRKELLQLTARNSKTAACLDLAIRTTVEVRGLSGLKALLTSTTSHQSTPLHSLCLFPANDKCPDQKLKLLIHHILSVGGKELLKQQLQAVDSGDKTCLHIAVENGYYVDRVSDTINMLFDAIVYVGGNDFLVKNFFDTGVDSKTKTNFVTRLFCNSPRVDIIEVVLSKIVNVGGINLLKTYMQQVEKHGKSPLSYVSRNGFSEYFTRLFAALLVKLDLFKDQYATLEDSEKEKLKDKAKIHIYKDDWLPTEDEIISPLDASEGVVLMSAVDNILQGVSSDNESKRRSRFEEEADAVLKTFEGNVAKMAEEEAAATASMSEEELAARKKAEEEAVAKKKAAEEAAAKKRAEMKAADERKAQEEAKKEALSKMTQEEIAAQKKAEEEAAAVKKAEELDLLNKANEEAAAKREAREAAAAARKQADKEAAAAEKKAKKEAAAAQKKAEEEAAAQKTAEEKAAVAKKKADNEAVAAAAAAEKANEEAAAAKKIAEEEAIAKKDMEEKISAQKKRLAEEAIAKKIAEEEAAIAQKEADEEAAAVKKAEELNLLNKANEEAVAKREAREAAAAARKQADKEAAAAEKKAKKEAAAAQKKAEEEAAAAKKKAEEEAAALTKKKAEEEAAAKKQAEANAAAEKKPEEGKTAKEPTETTKRTSNNEPAVAADEHPSSSSSTVPYEKMQEGPEETEKPVKQGCPCVIQ